MTHETTHSDVYDPEHPWIRDARDDPGAANWFAEFTLPDGVARQPVFLRGQMYLALLRTVFLLPAIGMLFGGQSVMAAAFAFFGIAITMFPSFVSHCRRLNDAARSGHLALLIVLPLFIASAHAIVSAQAVPGEFTRIEAEKAEAARAAEEAVETEPSEALAEASEAAEEEAEPAAHGRRGPPKPVTQMSLFADKLKISFLIWGIGSLMTMCFSLFYVARGKTVDRNSINGF